VSAGLLERNAMEDSPVSVPEEIVGDPSSQITDVETSGKRFPINNYRGNTAAFSDRWEPRVRHRVMLADAVAIWCATIAVFVLRYRIIAELAGAHPGPLPSSAAGTALVLMAVWYGALAFGSAWDLKLMAIGPGEYARVANITFGVFAFFAIIAFLTDLPLNRAFVAITLPLGIIFLCFGRWLMRRRLYRERRYAGKSMSKALLIGAPSTADHLLAELQRVPEAGFEVTALCTPKSIVDELQDDLAGADLETDLDESDSAATADLARLTSLDEVVPFAAENGITSVIVSGSDEINPLVLKRLSWALEPYSIRLLLAPELTGVAASRIFTHNVDGLPILHVQPPGYTSPQQKLKRCFDLVGAFVLLVIFSVPMLLTALVIKLTSPGPVLFRQTRVGADGRLFSVLKFRSMTTNAAGKRSDLDESIGLYVKPKNDPRITPIGRFIRRYSIDELPQLFNVIAGSMSIVGPRPFIPEESKLFSDGLERRLFVKPGMTGLWQVSGRSNLSAEESMRLDLYYVENWSLTEDLLILVRTARAVLGSDGAY